MVQIQNNINKIKASSCPGDGTCSNQGICDVSTGNCVCNSGFQGDMCQGNVCFIKIRSKNNSNTLLILLQIFMKQMLSPFFS